MSKSGSASVLFGWLIGWTLLACGAPESAPWGFDHSAERRFRLEMRDETMVDSVIVDIERLADVRFKLDAESASVFELEMFLDRYYLSVEGGQGGKTQVAISPEAFVSRAADGTELRLRGHEKAPSDRTVKELLELPIGGTAVDARGATVRSAWHSSDPLLEEVDLLGWLLLGMPIEGQGEAAWTASREVPRIGRYRLGVELPLRFETTGGGAQVGVAGFVERSEITLAGGYGGALELELEGQSQLGADGTIASSRYVLRMKFEAKDGSVIRSTHRVTLECLDCGAAFKFPREVPDLTFDE